MMSADWEREVSFNRRLRKESALTPYAEMARWRRRFYYALLIIAGMALVIVALLPWR